jgi:hypothetical protein
VTDDVVPSVAEQSRRAAVPDETVSAPVPMPERPQDGPGQPFGLSPVLSGSGGTSSGITLAVVVALLFLAVPPLSRRLSTRASVWRPGPLPSPLPRPG